MLNLPVYLRGTTWYIHTRVSGRQFKRSLQTSNKQEAMIKALSLIKLIAMSDNKIRKYELDEARGIARADDPEDHKRLMEALTALTALRKAGAGGVVAQTKETAKNTPKSGLKFDDLVDKFFQLKKQLKPSTVLAYKNTAKEIAKFLDNPIIGDVGISDITRYQEFIAKSNSPRTIDNKIATLRTLFYFAIKQGYYFNDNPATGRTIMSKTDKAKSGYGIFEEQEIEKIYQSENFLKEKETDPDFYWSLMLGLFTGCRISEITSLNSNQILVSERGVNFIRIRESKTLAGVRDIPISQKLFEIGFGDFIKDKEQIFKYPTRLGKGSGNAVGKKFKRLLEELMITREKLVFHSLRKFTNDLFLKENVPFEPRCQFFGHEIDNVNVATYSKKFSVDQLAEIIQPANQKLMMISGLIKTKF